MDAIPDDFPAVEFASAVSGVQPKVALTEHAGHYYARGNTPPERAKQWRACLELVADYRAQCEAEMAQAGRHGSPSQAEIIRHYYEAARRAHPDILPGQLRWVFQQVASALGWPGPEFADMPWLPREVEVDDALIEAFKKRMDETPTTKTHLTCMLEERIGRSK